MDIFGPAGPEIAANKSISARVENIRMSLTGPACEEGGKERGKKDPGFFLAPSVYLEVCTGI